MISELIERITLAMNVAAQQWALGTDNEAWECPYEILAAAAIVAHREANKKDWRKYMQPIMEA